MLLRTCALVALAACGDNSVPGVDAAAALAPDATTAVDFTETYAADSADVGDWILTTNPDRVRAIEPTGGDPGGYLYGDVSTAVPAWSTASPAFQPGVTDWFKRASVFVGDYAAGDVRTISADLDVIQVGNWSSGRTVTLHLARWDAAADAIAVEAFDSLPDISDAPVGWHSYAFAVDARSPTIPAGWQVLRGDGSPGSDADWATLVHEVDLVELAFGKPGYAYPSMGLWQLGLDNVHIGG